VARFLDLTLQTLEFFAFIRSQALTLAVSASSRLTQSSNVRDEQPVFAAIVSTAAAAVDVEILSLAPAALRARHFRGIFA
jgi:hypothetical protein